MTRSKNQYLTEITIKIVSKRYSGVCVILYLKPSEAHFHLSVRRGINKLFTIIYIRLSVLPTGISYPYHRRAIRWMIYWWPLFKVAHHYVRGPFFYNNIASSTITTHLLLWWFSNLQCCVRTMKQDVPRSSHCHLFRACAWWRPSYQSPWKKIDRHHGQ